MNDSAMLPVQTAIYGVLAGDPTLTGLVDGVYDAVPETAKPTRYVVIGESSEIDASTFGRQGRDELLSIHCYVQDTPDGAGFAAVKAINSRVIALLDGADLVVAGRSFVLCEFENSQSLRDAGWRQIVTDFRVITEGP